MRWYVFSFLCIALVLAQDYVRYLIFSTRDINTGTYDSVLRLLEQVDAEVHVAPPISLAAFYPTRNRGTPTREVLRRFRKFYPHVPLLIQNDMRDESVRALDANATFRFTEKSYGYSSYGVDYVEWMNGVLQASKDHEWVILLEDDVWVVRPFTGPFLYDINCGPDQFLRPELAFAMNDVCAGMGTVLGGFGGCIMRTSALSEVLGVESRAFYKRLRSYRRFDHFIASDEAVSMIMQCAGYTIGPYKGYTNLYFYDNTLRDAQVLHPVKVLYG